MRPQMRPHGLSDDPEAMIGRTTPQVRDGGQGQDRTADLPLFRIKDYRAGLAMVVSLPAQRAVVHADGPRCTWMYETTNETELSLPTWRQPC